MWWSTFPLLKTHGSRQSWTANPTELRCDWSSNWIGHWLESPNIEDENDSAPMDMEMRARERLIVEDVKSGTSAIFCALGTDLGRWYWLQSWLQFTLAWPKSWPADLGRTYYSPNFKRLNRPRIRICGINPANMGGWVNSALPSLWDLGVS